ncbi:uncharacterized protein [Hyperolius riggenbachi]|uniref:uncharacterized protein n=1 Tax=Hyperolius riggenbachi TaxID=752182 RepID=UPI0035A3BF4E
MLQEHHITAFHPHIKLLTHQAHYISPEQEPFTTEEESRTLKVKVKMMGPALVTVLCLLACLPSVEPITGEEWARVTRFVNNELIAGHFTFQYAFVVKLAATECRQLNENTIREALTLNQRQLNDLRNTVRNYGIYEGRRIVAASYSNETPRNHAEYRLLESVNRAPSPVQNLLNRGSRAGCVVFYSLYSPCLTRCVNERRPYNIINELDVFNGIAEGNKAFVFRDVYSEDIDRSPTEIWQAWGALNNRMTLYRCTDNNCIRCFQEGLFTGQCL